jgi:hypothetical protein
MITATAGFLSAATGVMVALNQVGVVNFKQMTGGAPAAQSTPAEPQAATGPADTAAAERKQAAAAPDSGAHTVAVREPDRSVYSAPAVPPDSGRPANGHTERVVGAQRPETVATSPSVPPRDSRPPIPQTETTVVEVRTRVEQSSSSVPRPSGHAAADAHPPAIKTSGSTAAADTRREEPAQPRVSRVPVDSARRTMETKEPAATPAKTDAATARSVAPPVVPAPSTSTTEQTAESKKQATQPPSAPAPSSSTDKPAQVKPAAGTSVVDAARREEKSPTAPRVQAEPVRPPPPSTEPAVPIRKPDGRTAPTTGPGSIAPPAGDPRPTGPQVQKKPADSNEPADPRNPAAPTSPPAAQPAAKDKVAPSTPDDPKRVAGSKKPEPSANSPPATTDDAKKAKTSRPAPEPAGPAAKAKGEPRSDERRASADDKDKDLRRTAADDRRRKPEEPSGASTSPGPRQLALGGLKLTVPAGWKSDDRQASPTSNDAVLSIPASGKGADGVVRITPYAGAKGKAAEEQVLDQWVGQMTKPNGSPMTRADAKVARTALGAVRLTTVELTGTVKVSARDSGQPGQRVLAAVLEHPRGAHLVVISGPAASMDQWASTIDSFLRSARAD